MRIVNLTSEDVGEALVDLPDQSVEVTGTDENTGELVTFSLSPKLAWAVRDLGTCAIPVADANITKVEPVSGEWDSPGTSPEDS